MNIILIKWHLIINFFDPTTCVMPVNHVIRHFILTAGKVLSQQVYKVLWHRVIIEFWGNFPLSTCVSLFQYSKNSAAQQEEVAGCPLPLLRVLVWGRTLLSFPSQAMTTEAILDRANKAKLQ